MCNANKPIKIRIKQSLRPNQIFKNKKGKGSYVRNKQIKYE